MPTKAPAKAKDLPAQPIDLARAYHLRYEKGLTHQQIGTLLGASESGIRAALKRLEAITGTPEEVNAYTQHREGITKAVEGKLLASLSDDTVIAGANLRDRAHAYAAVSRAATERTRFGGDTNVLIVGTLVQQADKALFPTDKPAAKVIEHDSGRATGLHQTVEKDAEGAGSTETGEASYPTS